MIRINSKLKAAFKSEIFTVSFAPIWVIFQNSVTYEVFNKPQDQHSKITFANVVTHKCGSHSMHQLIGIHSTCVTSHHSVNLLLTYISFGVEATFMYTMIVTIHVYCQQCWWFAVHSTSFALKYKAFVQTQPLFQTQFNVIIMTYYCHYLCSNSLVISLNAHMYVLWCHNTFYEYDVF